MKTNLLIGAALLALTGAAGAADFTTKAPMLPLVSPATNWSGFYVGLEAGYGWGTHSFDTNLNGANTFPTGPAGIVNDPFAFSGPGSSSSNGWLAGGFFGAQKQYGSWVFGIEGDVDATGMTSSFRNTSVTPETVNTITNVPEFVTTAPFTLANFTIPAFTIPAQNIVIPGQTITTTGTGTVAPTTIVLPAQTFTVGGQKITIPSQTVVLPVGPINIPTGAITLPTTITLPSQTITVGGQTITIPGQTITVTASGATKAVTITVPAQTIPAVTIPGQTVPGQTNPVLNANGAPVLQQVLVPTAVNVTRTVAIDTKIDELASLRGRVGYSVWNDNVLLYGTGGLALAHASATSTLTQTIDGAAPQISKSSASGTMLGWALGAGADFRLTPNVFVGVEYLHSDFPKNTFAFVDGQGAGFTLGNEHLKVDAVKARLGFLFN
jgi:opacity protein-like surface antigen